jgi:hypothetical protein
MLQKPDPGISATPHENNLRYFKVVIAGPQDSAYDGMCKQKKHTGCALLHSVNKAADGLFQDVVFFVALSLSFVRGYTLHGTGNSPFRSLLEFALG